MPKILSSEAQTSAIGPATGVIDPTQQTDTPDPTLLQTFGAAFRMDNTVSSLLSRQGGQGGLWGGISMDFDADEFVPKDLTEAGYNDRYIYAKDESQVHSITQQIRRENEDRQLLAASGGWGIAASIAAGVIDPINLIPFGGAAVKSVKGGKHFLQVAKATAMTGLASTTVAEGLLQSTQQTRTAGESVVNIAMGTALSGVLGAGVGAFADMKAQGLFTKGFEDMADELGVALSVPQEKLIPQPTIGLQQKLQSSTAPAPAGAAATPADQLIPELKSMQLATSVGYKDVLNIDVGAFLAKLPVLGKEKATFDYFNTPQLRNFKSENANVLWAQWRLTGSPLLANGHLDDTFKTPENVSQNIQLARSEFVAPVHEALQKARKEYKALVKSGEEQKLSEADFENRIYLAAKYSRETGVKPIDEAVGVWKNQFATYTKALKDLGYEVEDNYIPQQMNPRAIMSAEHGFIEVMREKLEREVQRAGQKLISVDKVVTETKNNIKASRSEMVRRANAAHKAAYKEVFAKTEKELEDLFSFDDFKEMLIDKAAKDSQEPLPPRDIDAMVSAAVSRAIRSAYSKHAKHELDKLNDSITKDFQSKLSDLEDLPDANFFVDDIIKETDPQIGAGIGGLELEIKKLEAEATEKILKKIKKEQAGRKSILDLDEEKLNNFVSRKLSGFIASKSKSAGKAAAKEARKQIESEFLPTIKALKKNLKEARDKAYKLRVKSEEGSVEIDGYLQRMVQRMNGLTRADDMAVAMDGLKAPRGYIGSAPNLRKRMIDWSEDEDLFAKLVDGGYVESQPSSITELYANTVIPDLEMKRMFGDVEGRQEADRILTASEIEFTEMNELIKAEKDPAKKAKLNKSMQKERAQLKRNVDDFKMQVARLTGRFHTDSGYSSIKQGAAVLKGFNIISIGGNFVRGSLPDLPRIMLVEASLPIYRDTIKKLPKELFSGLPRDEAVKQGNIFGTALNLVLPGRAAAISDMADQYTATNRSSLSEKMGQGVDTYFKMIGFHWWNDTMQSTTARATYSTLVERLRAVEQGKASEWEKAQLRAGGIDPDNTARILKLINKANVEEDALHKIDSDKVDFDDPDELGAYRQVQRHVLREVDTLIVNPGQDVPIVQSTTAGSLALQFQSFGYASQERSFLYYLQKFRYSPNKLGIGLAASTQISMGMLVAYLSMWGAGKAAETAEWGVEKWLLEGVDRSGVAASFMNQYHTVGSVLNSPQNVIGAAGMEALGMEPNFQPMTKRMNQNVLSKMVGPSGGALEAIGATSSGLAHLATGQGVTKYELKSALRLSPSVPFLSDALRTGINESDIQDDRKYKRKNGSKSVLFVK